MEALHKLARFLPEFSRPDFKAGERRGGRDPETGERSFPWTEFNPVVDQFVECAVDNGWVLPGFDWMNWLRTPETSRLRDDPAGLDDASPEQIARLLTAVIRNERGCAGSLQGDFESKRANLPMNS